MLTKVVSSDLVYWPNTRCSGCNHDHVEKVWTGSKPKKWRENVEHKVGMVTPLIEAANSDKRVMASR